MLSAALTTLRSLATLTSLMILADLMVMKDWIFLTANDTVITFFYL